ncbi:class Ib ribonucleoside-diphosphate reductase assembly flavoprotein NrdI, partial [Escherichia coli]|uniref:class Ib ribonucleoside-diphosphate reductase assembly flavoprotein NrdI n=1 Tax=Escherichia coli TaxID=562 RepID=UPI00093027E5
MSQLVYFSSSSENTQRFIERLGLPAVRIPLNERERIQVDELAHALAACGAGCRRL